MDLAAKLLLHATTFPQSPPAGLPKQDFGWGSKTFSKMGRKKIQLIATFLRLGVQVCICGKGVHDIDVAWQLPGTVQWLTGRVF